MNLIDLIRDLMDLVYEYPESKDIPIQIYMGDDAHSISHVDHSTSMHDGKHTLHSVTIDVNVDEADAYIGKVQKYAVNREFPNGFESFMETHHEVVTALTLAREKNHPVTETMNEEGGTGRFYEVATEWTKEFETTNKGREWDGEFFDEIESFINSKFLAYDS